MFVENLNNENLHNYYCNFGSYIPVDESSAELIQNYRIEEVVAEENSEDSFMVLSPPSRGKRHRTRYTTRQLIILEEKFRANKYITIKQKEELAEELQLTKRNVKVWFQNRRQKELQKERKILLEKERQSPLPILDPYEVEEFFKNIANMCASTHEENFNFINY